MEKPLNLVNPKGYRANGNTKPSPVNGEGLETILNGSTAKRLEKGATLPNVEGDDIVRSASKGVGIICNKCGVLQPKSSFYDRNRVCKSCYKERVISYQRGKGKVAHREACRRWCQRHPEKNGYKATDKNRAHRMVRYWEMMQESPERIKAQWTISNMVRGGTLIKPDRCSKCGRVGRVEGHHPDYGKPRLVEWVCSTCHKMIGTEVAIRA